MRYAIHIFFPLLLSSVATFAQSVNRNYVESFVLTTHLDGNHLRSVIDAAAPSNRYSSMSFADGADDELEYTYNGVGALTSDKNRGIKEITYDDSNNPRSIRFDGGTSISYEYLPDGTKLIVDMSTMLGCIVTNSWYTEYSGNVVYENTRLSKLLFPGGYCTFDGENGSSVFHYFTQDHLGNNRTVTNEDGTVEQVTHYYPFGGTFNDAGLTPELQQYKYNGKELDKTAGLNTYDYGARQYFPGFPGWDRMDPLCEKDYGTSPYVYCRNNPLKFIDKEGMKICIPYKKQREKILNYINSYCHGMFETDNRGYLQISNPYVFGTSKSITYQNRIIDAINEEEKTISVYLYDKNMDGQADDDSPQNYSIAKMLYDKGEGFTMNGNENTIYIILSGNNHNVGYTFNDMIDQGPEDILMHELIGHGIPIISPSVTDTGNAIKNENIVREEMNIKKRAEDENHIE